MRLKDIVGVGLMRSWLGRISQNPVVVPTALVVIVIVAFVIAANITTAFHVNRTANEALARARAVVEENDFPIGCPKDEENPATCSRRFLYRYKLGDSTLDVPNSSIEDWKDLHVSAEEEGELIEFSIMESDKSESWLNSMFRKASEPPYGLALTPFQANAIHFRHRDVVTEPPEMRLRFASNNDGVLYILSQIKNLGPDGPGLRLTVHYYRQDAKVFGTSSARVENTESGDISTSLTDDHFGLEVKRWKAEGGDWFFALALKARNESLEVTAIELVGTTTFRDEENKHVLAAYLFGTSEPLPLEEEVNTYDMSKTLRSVTSHYELYANRQQLSGTDNRATASRTYGPWQAWSQIPLYRLYFLVSGTGSCEKAGRDAFEPCFRHAEGWYWLRTGTTVEKKDAPSAGETEPASVPIDVFIEEPLVIVWSTALLIVALVVLVPLGFTAYSMALARESQIRSLERIKEALESYRSVFLHQAKNDVRKVGSEVSELVIDADEGSKSRRLEMIEGLLAAVLDRVTTSTEIFYRDENIREARKANYGRFDLVKTIDKRLNMFGNDLNLKFCHPFGEEDRRPTLGATAPTSGTEGKPDGSFEELILTIVQNAIDHRLPEGSPVTISLTVEWVHRSPYAVIEVKNDAPKIRERHLKRVFELGTQFWGAVMPSVQQEKRTRRASSFGAGAISGPADRRWL